jgi:hypothetical protein
MNTSVSETSLPNLNLVKRGKVRDIYDLGDALLMVASDRISAFDVVMPEAIPDKGKILNQISLFWFDIMAPIVANHVISGDVASFPESCKPYASELEGRTVLVQKAEALPIECVVRGYISGSGWKSYKEDQSVCGIKAAGRPERIGQAAGTDLHPFHQGRSGRARYQYRFRGNLPAHRPPSGRTAARSLPGHLPKGAPSWPWKRESSSPTPSLNSDG